MYVTTRTEVRTVRPFYIDNKVGKMISLFRPEPGYGLVFRPESVKIVALDNGKVSVKGLGKGGFQSIHLPGNTRLAVEGENSITLREFLNMYEPKPDGLNMAVQTD